MKTNNEIPFTDVLAITKDILEIMNGETYQITYLPIKQQGKECTSVIVSKSDKVIYEDDYCHIITYEGSKKPKYISFDSNAENSALFNSEYKYIETFFKSFIKFRNSLIEKNQTVKSDDIYQYLLSIVGFTKKDQEKTREMFKNRH